MAPNAPVAKPTKPYFFYGHRRPSQNRPVVYGSLFSSRKTLNPLPPTTKRPSIPVQDFDLRKWDPENSLYLRSSSPKSPTESFFTTSRNLSPIARFITDAFRKNCGRWGPQVIVELNKLRRVTPNLVAEVLKVETNPNIASKFFHWAGKQKGYRHTFAAYNAFAYCLNRNSQFRAADQLPELMDSQGKPPTEKQFEILIRMHTDANRGLRLYYIYEKMKKFGVKPRVFLYNRIIDGLVKTCHLDLALLVYEDFKGDSLAEESITYMILIKGLCKAGRIEEMLQLLGKMRDNLCKPDIFAYTAMVRLLVSEGNWDGCLRVWEEMRRDGVEADVMAYETLVAGLCRGGRVEKAYELFKEMKEKKFLIGRAIYGSLIGAFMTEDNIGLACDLWRDLIDTGYRADLGIYNTLIEGFCKANRVDKAHKLLGMMLQEDVQPDIRSINPILISYAELRKMDSFNRLLAQMKNLGFSVLEDLSAFFLSLVSNKERTLMAVEVFNDLKLRGYSSTAIYNILMGSLRKIGEVKSALSLFGEIMSSSLIPDSSTYSIAIECLVETGSVEEACNCYNRVIEISCLPSIDAYRSLAEGLCRIGEIDATDMLVRDCLGSVPNGPMEFKYYLAIIHACKSGHLEEIEKILSDMICENCPPSIVSYCAIISGTCKYGTIEDARKVFSGIKDRKLLTEAECIVYEEMLVEHTKRKTADLVVSGLKFFGLEKKLKQKGCNLLGS
ncbi:hypothetical protein SAY86_002487 [Trapa natans]|uniref:Pentatricopeptide repeat-containing protein n=1 Tax=Trapa natans TaxID=22666 RepID=A0AAN7LQC4_TRANT|nr:hypothetical protein SAY86_002487 [Trapa natans]